MSSPDTDLDQSAGQIIVMRLYVAGEAPNSQRALTTLRSLCEECLQTEQYEIEVIDILDDPLRALNDNILVTPTLLKLAPLPTSEIIGDLSNRASVLLALGIREPH